MYHLPPFEVLDKMIKLYFYENPSSFCPHGNRAIIFVVL